MAISLFISMDFPNSPLGRFNSPTSYATRSSTVTLKPEALKSHAQHSSDLCLVGKPYKMFDIDILRFILGQKLNTIVPQIYCEYFQKLTQIYRQGMERLMEQPETMYCFYPPQAWQLAADIDTLLASDILHQGISPHGMVLFEGSIYLLTGDAIGKIKLNKAPCFPMDFTPPELVKNKDLTIEQCKQIVKYNFFVSLMSVDLRRFPENGVFDPESISNFIEFIGTEPQLQNELFNFLIQPEQYDLSFPLADYFGDGEAATLHLVRYESLDNVHSGQVESRADYFEIKDCEREVLSLTHHNLPDDEFPQALGLSGQEYVNQHFSKLAYTNNLSERLAEQESHPQSTVYRNGYSVWELEKNRGVSLLK